MENDLFIPNNVEELYEKMICENFTGELFTKDDWLVWRLPNGITVKVAIDKRIPEGYIDTYYYDGKEYSLTHWHPVEEDIYNDLLKIENGKTFWVKTKKSIFYRKSLPVIMEMNRWETLSEKQKSKYYILD